MKKNKIKNNSLIKRKNLVSILKKEGIVRVGRDAIISLEFELEKYLIVLIPLLREEMAINGKKTLHDSEVKKVIKKMIEEDKVWEI